jgi:hypothetical protein
MISLFSRVINKAVDLQFRKDPSERLVFLPFGPKKKAYFVDSKSDEEKIRAFVKMYRSVSMLISLLIYPSVYIPGMILDIYGGLSPWQHRLTIALGISLFVWLVLVTLAIMLWVVYKATVPGLIASLSEVGPDLKGQLSEISPRPRNQQRVALACLLAGIVFLGLSAFGLWHYTGKKPPCPPNSTSTSR